MYVCMYVCSLAVKAGHRPVPVVMRLRRRRLEMFSSSSVRVHFRCTTTYM